MGSAMIHLKINGQSMIAVAMGLLFFYLCLPFSMIVLNSILIRALFLFSVMLFVTGMLLLKRIRWLSVFGGLLLILVLYYEITWSAFAGSNTYVFYCIASLMFVFGGMQLYLCEDKKVLLKLFIFITTVYFVTAITSIVGLQVYPLAARETARSSTYDTTLDYSAYITTYRKMNIVSWSQTYGMVFVVPTALMLWKSKRKIRYIALVIAVIVMLVSTQITVAVLLAVVFAFSAFILGEKSAKRIIILLILGLLSVIVILRINTILTYAVEVSEKAGLDFLTTKVNDLRVLLVEGQAVGDAGERGELYQKSFNAFLKNPVLGTSINGRVSLGVIGYHSEFFDLLGTFGLAGVAVMIMSLGGYVLFLRKVEKEKRRSLLTILIGFMALFVFNPVFSSPQVFAGAFLYPLLACKCSEFEILNDGNKRRFKI